MSDPITTVSSSFDGLEGWEEGQAPPKRRIKDAKSALALFTASRDADKENAFNRKMVQEMIDGEPPYDDAELESLGHAEAVNLNFLEGTGIIEAALSSYNDLTSSVDTLVTCHTTYGDPSTQVEMGQVISEEFTRMNKEWTRFEFNVQYLANKFVPHGVGIAFHDHDIDWRWKTAGMGDFLLPRMTEACEDELDYAIARRSYTVGRLLEFVEDPKLARENGWNPEMVKKAAWNAYNANSDTTGPSTTDWEEFQQQMKNNDLYIGHSKAPKVKVLHLYTREFDGTVSHYMLGENGQLDDFMYQMPSRFKSINDCFTIFTYGVGNGFYHGIRGLGYKIFPHIQVSNRLRCRLVEAGMLGSSMLIQPGNAEDLEALNLVYYGPYAVLPPNLNVVERTVPNFAQNVLPIVSDLSRLIQNNTGTYQSRSIAPEGQTERTKFEVQAQLQHESTLSTSAMNLFYLPWKRLMTSSFRRIQNKDYSQDDPGGQAVFEMRRRCALRGVPVQAIYQVDRIEPVRAIGYGSPGNRLLALDEITNLAPQFDPVGRRMALRDRVAVRVGYETADRYVPKDMASQRPPIDAKIAELENVAMHAGAQVTVQIGEMDVVHLGIHIADLTKVMADINAGQANPGELMPYFAAIFPHSSQHLHSMQADPMAIAQTKQIEQGLGVLFDQFQKMEAIVMQDAEQKTKNAQDQQAQAAEAQAQPQQDPALAIKLAESQAKVGMMEKEGQIKLTLKAQEAAQRMHIKDTAAAVKLQQSHVAHLQKAADAATV